MSVRKRTATAAEMPAKAKRRVSRKKAFVEGDLFENLDSEPAPAANTPAPTLCPVASTEPEGKVVPDEPDALDVPDQTVFLVEREKNRVKTSKSPRRRRALSSLFRDWYGETGAETAMMNHLPKSMTIGECLEKTMRRIVPPWAQTMEKIQANWTEIVGADNVRKILPAYIEKKVLYVELRHPMFRSAFDVPVVKSAMIANVNAFAGESTCVDIKFCARGEIQRKK